MNDDPEALHCLSCGHCWYDEDGPPGCPHCNSMSFEVVTWKITDQIETIAEHWALFDTCRGFDIEVDDDDPGPWTEDGDVIKYCLIEAIFGGSDRHRRALIFEQATHQHPNPAYQYDRT